MEERNEREKAWKRLLSLREAGKVAKEVADFLSDAINVGLGVPEDVWTLVEASEEEPKTPFDNTAPLEVQETPHPSIDEADADATMKFDVSQHGELGTATGGVETLAGLLSEAGELEEAVDEVEPAMLVFMIERIQNGESIAYGQLPASWRDRIVSAADLCGRGRCIAGRP